VDEYIAKAPKDRQERMEEIRSLIFETVPEVVETIGYGMPSYKLHGRQLVYFYNANNHVSFFSGRDISEFKSDKFEGLIRSKSGFQMKKSDPFPADLIKEILAFRVEEVRKAAKKK
jgi:uncharacterized protein YdhG (YjbR/CyaY superfamily)